MRPSGKTAAAADALPSASSKAAMESPEIRSANNVEESLSSCPQKPDKTLAEPKGGAASSSSGVIRPLPPPRPLFCHACGACASSSDDDRSEERLRAATAVAAHAPPPAVAATASHSGQQQRCLYRVPDLGQVLCSECCAALGLLEEEPLTAAPVDGPGGFAREY